jgi:hypothetical protein
MPAPALASARRYKPRAAAHPSEPRGCPARVAFSCALGLTGQHRGHRVRSGAVSSRVPEIRASDAERAEVAEALRAHCAAGRLQVEELEQRLAAALSAHTVGELERLVQDLPRERPAPALAPRAASGKVRPGLPGLRSFRQPHEFSAAPERSFRQALEHILPVMVAEGFNVISRVEQELLVFERRDERVILSFNRSAAGGTRLVVQGRARWRVRKVFAKLVAD